VYFRGLVGQTIAVRGLSCLAKSRLGDRRQKAIVCPTSEKLRKNAVRRRNRLRHQRQVICMHWWDRLQPVNARLRAHFFLTL
jgi:hypothetical protein